MLIHSVELESTGEMFDDGTQSGELTFILRTEAGERVRFMCSGSWVPEARWQDAGRQDFQIGKVNGV